MHSHYTSSTLCELYVTDDVRQCPDREQYISSCYVYPGGEFISGIGCRGFLQSQANGGSTPRPLPFASFAIYESVMILWSDAVYPELMTAPLNKP
jgi:hypothetical protein